MTTSEVALLVAGVDVIVAVPPEAQAAVPMIRRAWSRCLADDDAPPTHRVLPLGLPPSVAPGQEADQSALVHALRDLSQAVTMEVLKAHAGRAVLLHSGAASDPDTGRTVAFVAASGTGKTTLSRHLSSTWGYVSDESVIVGGDQRITPYPKPLSVVTDSGPKHEVSPDDLHLLPSHAEPRLTHLALLVRDGAATSPTASELHPVDAMVRLAPQTSGMGADAHGLQRLAELVAAVGPVVEYRYAESTSIAELLRAAASLTPAGHEPAQITRGHTTTLGRWWRASEGAITLCDVVTLLDWNDRHLVFDGVAVSEISALAALLLHEAACTTSRDRVVATLVERFGDPDEGDAGAFVDDLVDDFVSRGWLKIGEPQP